MIVIRREGCGTRPVARGQAPARRQQRGADAGRAVPRAPGKRHRARFDPDKGLRLLRAVVEEQRAIREVQCLRQLRECCLIAAADDRFRNVVPTAGDTLRHAHHRQVGVAQGDEDKADVIAGQPCPSHQGEGLPAGKGRFPGEALPRPNRLGHFRQDEPPCLDRRRFGPKRVQPSRDDIAVQEAPGWRQPGVKGRFAGAVRTTEDGADRSLGRFSPHAAEWPPRRRQPSAVRAVRPDIPG
jgi:hypothetical protein